MYSDSDDGEGFDDALSSNDSLVTSGGALPALGKRPLL